MPTSCPFCAYVAGRFGRDLVVYEDEHVLVVPSLRQKRGNRGHCIVASRVHVGDLYELSEALAAPLLLAVSAAARASQAAFAADGVSVRQNNGPASGQDVFHLHFHVAPRFDGDDFETASYAKVDERVRIAQAEALRRAWPR